jgi:hypothetical protein
MFAPLKVLFFMKSLTGAQAHAGSLAQDSDLTAWHRRT